MWLEVVARISHDPSDRLTARLLAFLSSTDAQAVSEDPFEAEAAVGALRAAEAGLEQMAQDHYVHRLIGRAEFMAARAGLEAQVEDAKRRITGTSRLPELALGPEVKVQWETADLPWRRSVVEGVIDRGAGGRRSLIVPAPGARRAGARRIAC